MKIYVTIAIVIIAILVAIFLPFLRENKNISKVDTNLQANVTQGLNSTSAISKIFKSFSYKNLKESTNSDFFIGTVAIGFMGGILSGLYVLAQRAWSYFVTNFMATITVNNDEEAFEWIVEWLGKNKHVFLTAPCFTVSLQRDLEIRRRAQNIKDIQILFVPGDGIHIFTYKGKIMWIERRSSNNLEPTGWNNEPFLFETIKLTTFGRGNEIFKEFLNDAMKTFIDKYKGKTKMYIVGSHGNHWRIATAKDPRPMDSVVLDSDYSEELYQDAKQFLSRAEWYYDKGIPYRRGYLLYGPPGCGKTSFVTALAGKLKLNICVLTLSSGKIDDDGLNRLFHDAPKSSIILLEDIDSVFVDRNVVRDINLDGKHVTFSGLLNAIDGVASQEGKLFFMTTNHIEKLDPALLRPGRCDVKIEFKRASKMQIETLFNRFYPNSNLASKFSSFIPDHVVSMAQLQGHFMKYKNEPEEAIKNVQTLLDEAVSEKGEQAVEIDGWLKRLGLSNYIENFKKEKIRTLADISKVNNLNAFHMTFTNRYKIFKYGDRMKIYNMLKGKKKMIQEFQYAPSPVIKKIFLQFYPNLDNKQIDTILEIIPSEKFTILELKSFLYKYEGKPIEEVLKHLDTLLNPPKISKIEEPKVEDIKDWLSKLGYDQYLDSFLENEITNTKLAAQLTTSDISHLLKIPKKGHRIKIMREINKLKKRFNFDTKREISN